MKVLVVAPSLRTRGGITSVVRLHMRTNVWKEANCEHLPTHEDGSALKKLGVAASSYLLAVSKIRRADLVHIHLAGERSLLRKLPIAVMARILRRPYIAHIHAAGPDSLFLHTPRWATQWVLTHAARVLALSSSWADTIRQNVPAARVEVLHNPVVMSSTAAERDGTSILFAGKLEPRKGYLTLLNAVPAILKIHPGARFIFAGHGATEDALQMAVALGISDSVQVLGWVDEVEMNRLYARASIFCLPSRNEGVPMSVLEAMSCGVPVVCTPVGGLPEIIVNGKNGMMATVDDPISIARCILSLLDDPRHLAAVGEAGRKTVLELCSLEQIDLQMARIYTDIAAEGLRSVPAKQQFTDN